MYIRKKSKDEQDLDLGKFYEDRISFYEKNLNKSAKTISKLERKTSKQKVINFEPYSNHKNVYPNQVLSYTQFKTQESPKSQRNNRPLSVANLNHSLTLQQKSKNIIQSRKVNNNDIKNITKDKVNSKNTRQNKIFPETKTMKFNSFREKGKSSNNNNSNHKKPNPIIVQNNFNQNQILFSREISPKTPILLNQILTEGINPQNKSILSISSIHSNMSPSQCIPTKIKNTDLTSIYEKRRAILEQKEKEEAVEKSLDVYNRNKKYIERSRAKSLALKEQLNKSELEQCSFTPKITPSTEKILNQSVSYRSYYSIDDFYQRNIEWKSNRDKTVKNQSSEFQKKKYEECSFQPNHNDLNKSQQIIREIKTKEPDYIYKKNIEWLNKVKENRKHEQLEIMEERKRENERFRTMNYELIKHGNKDKDELTFKEKLEILARPKYISDKAKRELKINPSYIKGNKINKEEEDNEKDFGKLKSLIQSLKKSLKDNQIMKEQIMNTSNAKEDNVIEMDKDNYINNVN